MPNWRKWLIQVWIWYLNFRKWSQVQTYLLPTGLLKGNNLIHLLGLVFWNHILAESKYWLQVPDFALRIPCCSKTWNFNTLTLHVYFISLSLALGELLLWIHRGLKDVLLHIENLQVLGVTKPDLESMVWPQMLLVTKPDPPLQSRCVHWENVK